VGNKAVSHLARVQQCAVLIVPNDDGIDGISRNIAANYEFLASVDGRVEDWRGVS